MQALAGMLDDTTQITFTVSNARSVASKTIFALVDVEVQIAGIAFGIIGVQARSETDGQTSVRLPTFKDSGGTWRPAIRLPDEVRQPLAEAVLTFLVEEGLAKHR
jgi:hypothetical protein